MIKIDKEKALRLFTILDKLWQKKEGICEGVVLPQNLQSNPSDPKECALWLFYCSLPMRGGLVSEDPFKWMYVLKELFPEMFIPEIVCREWTPEKIVNAFQVATKKILNGNGVGISGSGAMGYKADEYAGAWFGNSVVLHKYWGGDVRNVFWGVLDFEEAFRRVDYRHNEAGFKGMRRKIFSLLAIFLQEKGIIPVFPTPIPIDFHAMRILWGTEALILNGCAKPFMPKEKHPKSLEGRLSIRVSEKFIDQIAKWSQKFLRENNLSHLNVNPAIWVLSRSLCSEHFQTGSRKDGNEYVDAEALLRNKEWPKNYRNPCKYCDIEKLCQWIIPAAPYYRWGYLIRISERVPFPYETMHLPGLDLKFRSRRKQRR